MLKKQRYRDELVKHQEQLAQQTKRMTDEMGTLLQNPNLNMEPPQDGRSAQAISSPLRASITNAGESVAGRGGQAGIAIQTLNVSGNVQIQQNDRLIQSIQMIKEILQSNMQLREDQLKLAEEHESALQDNYQLKIENEDLRDRLHMVTKDADYAIEYQSYLPVLDLEAAMDQSQSLSDLKSIKSLIMTYVFSLKKENRHLHKRLNDRLYHNKRHEEEALKAELKYLPETTGSTMTRQNSVVQPSSGILKKSDGFGLTSMASYDRPSNMEDNFRQYKDMIDALKLKQR